MILQVGLAGWLGCAVALLLAAWARRALVMRVQAEERVCHELRGPLTAARLGIELEARAGRLPPQRVRAIDLELGRASTALEDLLAGAWVDRRGAGSGVIEPLEVDMEALVGDSVEAWAPATRQKGVELRLAWSGDGATVRGDRLRLAQVTGNLIANAIEHGAGPVQVTGRVEGRWVRVEVLDAGPGLSGPMPGLGRPGRGLRGRREWWGARGGPRGPHGHGLAIACAVAAAHGGRVIAGASEKGARLVLELPVTGLSPEGM